MKRSINEIQGIVLKAARGAGVSLGVAEDLAACVPFSFKDNALADIADILGRSDHLPLYADIASLDARICGKQDAELPRTSPALTRALAASRGLEPQCAAAVGAQSVSDLLWGLLEDLAARTYVPASEASRMSGAGASLSDND